MTDTTSANLIASTVATLPGSAAERFGDRVAARYKVGDEWRELSYGDAGKAIDEIAQRLGAIAERDPQAILPYSYAGTMGLVQGDSMSLRFFNRLGASLLDRTICATAGARITRRSSSRCNTVPSRNTPAFTMAAEWR